MGICSEDFEDVDEQNCGEVRVSIYWIRPAAQHWQMCYTELLVGSGVNITRASTYMIHNEKDLDVLLHGDDFVALGDEGDFKRLQIVLGPNLEISVVMSDPGDTNPKEAKVLNRIIPVADDGYTYDADARRAESIIKI